MLQNKLLLEFRLLPVVGKLKLLLTTKKHESKKKTHAFTNNVQTKKLNLNRANESHYNSELFYSARVKAGKVGATSFSNL